MIDSTPDDSTDGRTEEFDGFENPGEPGEGDDTEPVTALNDDDPLTVGRDPFTVTFPGTDIPFRELTIADLAAFPAVVGEASMQPRGWGVVGLDTNFLVDADTHVLSGDLLGLPAEVRFTPIAYRWDYGDGSSAELLTPGAAWAVDASEFTPTASSHVFGRTGSFEVAVTVSYSAEYRLGQSGWAPVAGTVAAAAEPLTAVVVSPRTVLVQESCRPTRIGC